MISGALATLVFCLGSFTAQLGHANRITVADVNSLQASGVSSKAAGAGEWCEAMVGDEGSNDPAAGVLNLNTMAAGTNFFWKQGWKKAFGGPDLPDDHVLVGLHASKDKGVAALMANPINMSRNAEAERQFLGPGFYMLNGYSVNDNRPAPNVDLLVAAARGYAEQQSKEGHFGSILAFVVAKADLLGQQFAVRTASSYPPLPQTIPDTYDPAFEDAYNNRASRNQARFLPDATVSAWTPMWFGGMTKRGGNPGGSFAEVKASAALAAVMKPFAWYKCHRKSSASRPKGIEFKGAIKLT